MNLRFLSILVVGLAVALVSSAAMAQDLVVLDCSDSSDAFDCAAATGGSSSNSLIAAPSTLNPITSEDTASLEVQDHFLGTFFTGYALLALGAQGTVPQVAAVVEVSEDGASVTYTLRSGITYSDGSPVTVDDILYWYNDVVYNPNLPNSNVDAFTCPSDGSAFNYSGSGNQLTISCPAAYRTFTGTAGAAFVLSKQMALDLIAAQGVATEPGVTGARATAEFMGLGAPLNMLRAIGPFTLAQLDSQSVARYTRNPNFYEVDSNGTRLPYLDEYETVIIPTAGQNLSLSNFLAGQTDVIAPRPSDIAPILGQAAGGGFAVNGDIDNGTAASGTVWVGLNYDDTDAGLANAARRPNVRRALSLAIDRVAQVNNVVLGIGAPQYLPITLSGGSLSTFFIGRDNTCATFAPLGVACGQNAGGEDVLTVRSGLQIKAKILPAYGVSPELDEHLGCLVDYDGCVAKANAMLDAEGLKDTDGDGIRNLSTGSNWRISSQTNAGNTVREGYNQIVCDGWRRLGIDCSANSIAFATLVAQLTGSAPWSGTILLGLTGGDPAGGVNVYKCGAELYFWHFSCDPEATSGPTAQTPSGAEVEAGFDAGYNANSVEDAQAGFDQFQLAWAKYEPMIHLAVQNALFASRVDRLCNDGRATIANDDVKFKTTIAGNSCPSNAGR